MRFEPMTVDEIEQIDDWIPQAILMHDITAVLVPGFAFHEGVDGLDTFEGVFGYADGRPIAFKRHKGHPVDRITLYLPRTIETLPAIDAEIRMILGIVEIAESAIHWERRHWVQQLEATDG